MPSGSNIRILQELVATQLWLETISTIRDILNAAGQHTAKATFWLVHVKENSDANDLAQSKRVH